MVQCPHTLFFENLTARNRGPAKAILTDPTLYYRQALLLKTNFYRPDLHPLSPVLRNQVNSVETKSIKAAACRRGGDYVKLSSYIRGLSLYPAVFAALPGFNFSFPFAAEAREKFLQDPYLPIFLLCICFFLLLRLQTGRPFFNMNRPASALKQKSSTTFADAAGLHAEKRELQEVVNFLKDPARYEAMGARMPKGVLLTGHPGTGKTLLARAVAGEAGVPFYSVSGSEFIEMFVGVGAARVRNLFKQAQKKPPAVIFIDELDALGSRRGSENSLHEETAQTLNQLLVELDGFDQRKGVVVLAATNRPDVLDPALLRPGRFDRRLAIGLPGRGEREEILKLCTKSKPFIRSLNYKTLALLTPGFSGADLENLVNEAALLAVRCRKKRIGMPELEEALDRAIAGVRNSSSSLDQEKPQFMMPVTPWLPICSWAQRCSTKSPSCPAAAQEDKPSS